MIARTTINTRWVDRLDGQERPTPTDLCEHLLEVHRHHTGFTETCASLSCDSAGRNSYEWLIEAVDADRHQTILDLACGSGPLTELCHRHVGQQAQLIGVDMSADELRLARARVPEGRVEFRQALAQDMAFLDDDSVDVVLCHWALTLMDPVEPVLAEIRRVLRPEGVFAAIVDGDMETTPCYQRQHQIIYDWVRRDFPRYGAIDLGDPRVRKPAALGELINDYFCEDQVMIEPSVVELQGDPETLARQAAGFFYASFVLSPDSHAQMLENLQQDFAARCSGDGSGHSRFRMPINRLVVQSA